MPCCSGVLSPLIKVHGDTEGDAVSGHRLLRCLVCLGFSVLRERAGEKHSGLYFQDGLGRKMVVCHPLRRDLISGHIQGRAGSMPEPLEREDFSLLFCFFS